MKSLSIVFMLLISFVTFGESERTKCTVEEAVRCPCPASLGVSCTGYSETVYVGDEQKVEEIVARISSGDQSRFVTLKKPALGIRSYYGGDLLKEELKEKGNVFGSTDVVSLDSFTASGDASFYTSSGDDFSKIESLEGKKAVKNAGSTGTLGEQKALCSWARLPDLIEATSCGNNKLCFGYASCKGRLSQVYCNALGNGCPSADACAADPAVIGGKPGNANDFTAEILRNSLNRSGGDHE